MMIHKHSNARLVALLMAILAMLTLAACDASDPSGDSDTTVTATTSDTEPPVPVAPDFAVLDANGNSVRLSDLRGKPVVLNFWASWCPPCKAEMPDFETMYQRYGDRVHFMVVNLTDGNNETVDSAKNFIAAQGYTFPVYFDTTMQAANTYGITSIPTTYFVNADGTLRSYANGMLDAETLEKQLKLLLGE